MPNMACRLSKVAFSLACLLSLDLPADVSSFTPLVVAAATTIARPPTQEDTLITSAFAEASTAIPTKEVVTRVAVAGATGRTGRYVVEELINRGVSEVVAVVRDMEKAAQVFPNPPSNLKIVQCDLSSERQIAEVLNDVDAAIWCATGFSDAPAGNTVNVFNQLMRLFGMVVTPNKSIDVIGLPAFSKILALNQQSAVSKNTMAGAAATAGVKFPKLVMCSSAGVTRTTWSSEKKEKFAGCADIPIVRLNPFGILDRKRESEINLRSISPDYCIVRPCGLNDKWPAGSRPMFSQGDVAVGRLNRKDLATVLVDVLSAPEATAKTFEVVGIAGYPQPLSLRPALSRLYKDSEAPTESDELLFATYTTMQQLLPGEKQDAAALAMGQTYEQLDQGTTGRLGERGTENAESVAPRPSSVVARVTHFLTAAMVTNLEEQAKLDAALDAALDALDDSDDEDDNDHNDKQCKVMSLAPTQSIAANTSAISNVPTVNHSKPPVVMGPPRPPKVKSSVAADSNVWSPDKLFDDMMKQMIEGSVVPSSKVNTPTNDSGIDSKVTMEDGDDAFVRQLLSETQKLMQQQLSNETGETKAKPKGQPSRGAPSSKTAANKETIEETKNKSKPNGSSSSFNAEKAQVEEAFSNLMQGIAEQSSRIIDDDDDDATHTNIDSEPEFAMIQSLLETLASAAAGLDDMSGLDEREAAGAAFNPDAVVDGMMEQLLSKDLMYEPMKQVATHFPAWLQEHKCTLSDSEYAERQKQCDCFVRLVRVYETEPSNVSKLMELMQDVQEYGQPPVEIIQAIAPGIELDEEGMPKLDGTGLPFGNGSNDECVIM